MMKVRNQPKLRRVMYEIGNDILYPEIHIVWNYA
jgi:hypothetical protein